MQKNKLEPQCAGVGLQKGIGVVRSLKEEQIFNLYDLVIYICPFILNIIFTLDRAKYF